MPVQLNKHHWQSDVMLQKPKYLAPYETMMATDEYHLVEHRRGRQGNTNFHHQIAGSDPRSVGVSPDAIYNNLEIIPNSTDSMERRRYIQNFQDRKKSEDHIKILINLKKKFEEEKEKKERKNHTGRVIVI